MKQNQSMSTTATNSSHHFTDGDFTLGKPRTFMTAPTTDLIGLDATLEKTEKSIWQQLEAAYSWVGV